VKLGSGARCVRRSGRGGEERGARMSAMEFVGGGGTFYKAGEAAGGGGVLIPASFEGVKGEEETGRRRLDGELEGDNLTLRFDFTWVREGVHRRHMARRRGTKGSGGAAGNGQRWEMSGENGLSGLRRPIGQLGRCEAFRPREEGECSGLSWTKTPDGLGAMVGFTMKNQEKEKG
jgi:hypothetical protein